MLVIYQLKVYINLLELNQQHYINYTHMLIHKS
jgi:hypothetical protein